MTDYADLIDRLAAAATDAREATREAHAATKDLRQAEKQVMETVHGLVKIEWEARVGEAIKAGLETFSADVQQVQDRKCAQVIAAFGRLTNLLMRGVEKGRGEFLIPASHRLHRQFRQAENEAKAASQ